MRKEAANLKSQGIDIIIVLSHCGLDVDLVIAEKGGPDISVIVGGHTHTFMYSGPHSPGPDIPVAEYPDVVNNSAGHKVLVVQASALSKYVGDLTVWFDHNGKAASWSGDPIFLGTGIEQGTVFIDLLSKFPTIIVFSSLLISSCRSCDFERIEALERFP